MFLSVGSTPSGRLTSPTDTPLANVRLFDRPSLYDPRTAAPIIPKQKFPVLGWDPILKAMAIAAEFAATGDEWRKNTDPGTPPDPANDIATLMSYRDYGRSTRQDEINAQEATFHDYFAHLLGAMPPSRPHTNVLIWTGIYVASIVASYWKLKYMRARPVQVCASVFPCLMTPPHPSYPSGHGLQGVLTAKCVKLVTPSGMHVSLDTLGARVGENREYAGVHYPSDTEASRRIAPEVFRILNDPTLVPEFDALVRLAKEEWNEAQDNDC